FAEQGTRGEQLELRDLGAHGWRGRLRARWDLERHSGLRGLNACCRDLSDFQNDPVDCIAIVSVTGGYDGGQELPPGAQRPFSLRVFGDVPAQAGAAGPDKYHGFHVFQCTDSDRLGFNEVERTKKRPSHCRKKTFTLPSST